ncbi:MAG: hypothetical protein HKO65_05620 [Gemmatimonadetes bacterium]|nr:hypothetical protein [Gemmatimonadota bacterium]
MVLESYLSDLRMEIADTHSMDFGEKLKPGNVPARGCSSLRQDPIENWG